MKKIYQITEKKAKRARTINAIVCWTIALVVNIAVVYHWDKLGIGPKSLLLAFLFYTSSIGTIWYAIRNTINEHYDLK